MTDFLWKLQGLSRPLRMEYPGAVYHITPRGNERKSIFMRLFVRGYVEGGYTMREIGKYPGQHKLSGPLGGGSNLSIPKWGCIIQAAAWLCVDMRKVKIKPRALMAFFKKSIAE